MCQLGSTDAITSAYVLARERVDKNALFVVMEKSGSVAIAIAISSARIFENTRFYLITLRV